MNPPPPPSVAPHWVRLNIKRKWKHPVASRFLQRSKAARLLIHSAYHAGVCSNRKDTTVSFAAFIYVFIYLYLTRFIFDDASPLNGLCPAVTLIMGEGSLDDQLRGEVMWSSFTDAVDMSNSSSSLSTEERHSNAPGSVSEILKLNKNTLMKQKHIRVMWIWSKYGIYLLLGSTLRYVAVV